MTQGGPDRRDTFDGALRDFGDALWRLTAGYARSEADRKDLHQDILVALWEALPRFQGRSSLRTFVYRIAHNRGLSFRSYEARRRHASMEEAEFADPGPGPDEQADLSRKRQLLQEAVRSLPPPLRQPIMLHLDGVPNAEIAEIVGISEGNVAVRLTRARKTLRTELRGRIEND